MLDGPGNEAPQPPPSAEVILKGEASRYRAYLGEAEELLVKKDASGSTQKKLDAGRVIAGLHAKLMQDGVDRAGLSEAQLADIEAYSDLAKGYVERGNTFGIDVLFTPKGSRIGEPDELEKLIEKAYPPTPKAVGK